MKKRYVLTVVIVLTVGFGGWIQFVLAQPPLSPIIPEIGNDSGTDKKLVPKKKKSGSQTGDSSLNLPPLSSDLSNSAPMITPIPLTDSGKKIAPAPVIQGFGSDRTNGEEIKSNPIAPNPAKKLIDPFANTKTDSSIIKPIKGIDINNETHKNNSLNLVSPGNSISPDMVNPTGHQEPAVSLEWIGPGAVKIGKEMSYGILVRNTSAIPVQKVMVQVRIPQEVQLLSTEPKAESMQRILVWELGTLLSKQEKRLDLKLMCKHKGDMNCQAWVTFTGSSMMKFQVREPKIMIKTQTSSDKVLIGDPTEFKLTISNPGDHPADHVRVSANLTPGLESARGNLLNYDLGTIAAGQTQTLVIQSMTKAAGEQSCQVAVVADDGLKANDMTKISVIQPRLELNVQGPKIRYKDRKAIYSIKVTNPGDAPAGNVFITHQLPAGMKYLQSDNGGQHDFATRTVKWFIGEIGPNQSKLLKIEVMADTLGEQIHTITANASRGMKAEKIVHTTVEGVSAILMEVVDVDDPIEVGAETTYEIKITNTGSKTETNLKLACKIPTLMEFKTAQGPVRFNQIGADIVFEPLAKLAPKADVVYKVIVKAKTKGDARFRTQLTSTNLVEPVVKVEATRIYED